MSFEVEMSFNPDKKFWDSYILDLAKTVKVLRILSQKSTRNFGIKELWALENHVLATLKNLPKMAVLKERLNKTDMEKVG